MLSLVEDKKEEIFAACQRYGVGRLDLFGSAAGKDFDPGRSDLDFVVSFERRDPQNLFDRYFGLKEDLENLFGRRVDLVMEGALHRDQRFAAGVDETRVALYAA